MNPYKDAKASLIKFAREHFVNDPMFQEEGTSPPEIVDFDILANEQSLTKFGDIIGLEDYSIVDEAGMFTVTARIGMSTINDQGLFRLREMTNTLFNMCGTNKMVPLFDAETDEPIGQMKFMEGTTALPLMTTEIRSYQYLAVSLGYARSPGPVQP